MYVARQGSSVLMRQVLIGLMSVVRLCSSSPVKPVVAVDGETCDIFDPGFSSDLSEYWLTIIEQRG
jgi:hypothetical protein